MHNNNLSPIPFFGSLAEQDFKKWYAYGEHTPLRVTKTRLSPFFFFVSGATSSPSVTSAYLYNECGERVSGAYETSIKNAISYYVNNGGVTFYFVTTASDMSIPKGFYYLAVTVSVGGSSHTLYSGLFRVCEADEISRECVAVKWYDAEDVEITDGGVIPFNHIGGGSYYYNQLYLLTDIGMPEYSFTEEGEDRNGYFFPVKQVSEKVYKMTFIATECMCDCLRLACQSDVIKITDRNGKIYDVEHFEMNVTWLDGGFFAQVDCSFETDTVVKKIGKSYGTIASR